MKRLWIPLSTILVLSIASWATAAGPVPADDSADRLVQGTILTISPITGDLMLSQDEGTVIVVYGIDPATLQDLVAGDRVTVLLGANSVVREVARSESQNGH